MIVGGADYLTIPFNHEEVLAKIETHLKLRFMEIEIQNLSDRYQKIEEKLMKIILNKLLEDNDVKK